MAVRAGIMMNIRPFEGVHPDIHDSVWIDDSAVVIGDVVIGSDSSIWPATVVRGDINTIRIGERTNIQDGCVCHVTHDSDFCPGGENLVIGNDVTVGHKVILHACTIGDRCLIGMGAIIMDGVQVPDDCMVGAGAVVTPGKKLESGYLYVGSPARKTRPLNESELRYLKYSAENYMRLKDRFIVESMTSE